MTGDTHGDFSRLRPAAFREQGGLTKDDYCCRSFGHYRDNRMSKVEPILRIVQICQDPYRQAVKERAAQRRFFLYCFATKTAKWAREKVIWQLPSISFDRVENRIAAHVCGGSVGKVEECFWCFLLIDCGSAACYTGSNKRTGVDSDMDTLMEFSIQGDIFFFYDTLSDERRLPHHLWRLYRVNFYTEKFQNPVNKQILHKIFRYSIFNPVYRGLALHSCFSRVSQCLRWLALTCWWHHSSSPM